MVNSFCRLAVILLSCCLTLAASGDDASLIRVMAPSLSPTDLSWDDPNADFLTSAGSSTSIAFLTPPFQQIDISLERHLSMSVGATSFLNSMRGVDMRRWPDILTC
jgi:hypothetical protein